MGRPQQKEQAPQYQQGGHNQKKKRARHAQKAHLQRARFDLQHVQEAQQDLNYSRHTRRPISARRSVNQPASSPTPKATSTLRKGRSSMRCSTL